jgi:hypothetical protein
MPVAGLAVLVLVTLHALLDFSQQILGVAVYVAISLAAAVPVALGRADAGPADPCGLHKCAV